MILALTLTPTTGWVVVIALGILWVGLGLYWGRKAKDSEGFMLAGRNIGLALGSATAMATWITSNTVMVAPKLAFTQGIWGMIGYSTAAFGLMLFAPLAMRIRRLLPEGVTAGDFFRQRYGLTGWIIFFIITLVYSIAWLVTMAIAGGELLNVLTGIPYVQGMSLILIVCVLYTIFGGLYAVVGTDFIQSLIILIGIVIIGVLVLTRLDIGAAHEQLSKVQPELLSSTMPVALLAFFNIMLFGFGEVFHNNVWWSRAFAMREKIAPKAFFLSGILWFPIPIAAGFAALAAGPLGVNITDSNQTGPAVAEHVMAQAGLEAYAGLLILIVLFCSIASSIDSLLAATSDLILNDFSRKVGHQEPSEKNFRRGATIVTLSVGALAWTLAVPRWPLVDVLYSSGPLVASLIWPVIAGLYWKRINRPVVLGGIITGCTLGVIAYYHPDFGWYTASLIGAAISMLATIAARWIAPKPYPTA
ncbi:sodium:solute symporter family transporter [Haloferula sp.]|uniref:sodium:solute symporter family transporter n=1 Tax=Haloferula sp. TaxID=2497595 RepID=UPI003C7715CC